MFIGAGVVVLVIWSKIKKRVAYNVARLKEDQDAGVFKGS